MALPARASTRGVADAGDTAGLAPLAAAGAGVTEARCAVLRGRVGGERVPSPARDGDKIRRGGGNGGDAGV